MRPGPLTRRPLVRRPSPGLIGWFLDLLFGDWDPHDVVTDPAVIAKLPDAGGVNVQWGWWWFGRTWWNIVATVRRPSQHRRIWFGHFHLPAMRMMNAETMYIGPICITRPRPYIEGPARMAHAQAFLSETRAVRDVVAERVRQVTVLGWTSAHDDEHDDGNLAAAASAYSVAAADALHPLSQGDGDFESDPPPSWPWDRASWKPADARRMLVKAGALIVAEIDRLDRATVALPEER